LHISWLCDELADMSDVDAVINRIRAFAAARGLSASGLALAAGLSPNALRGFLRPNWSPRASTLRKLTALIPDDFETGAEKTGHGAAA